MAEQGYARTITAKAWQGLETICPAMLGNEVTSKGMAAKGNERQRNGTASTRMDKYSNGKAMTSYARQRKGKDKQ